MIRNIYQNIISNQEVRGNLITLKEKLKEDIANKQAFLYELNGDYTVLYALLQNVDAKVRKNIALIMGELAIPEFLTPLYEAYEKEDKLFVKSEYLTALRHFDYLPLVEKFKERLDYLTTNTFEEASLKHINEETRILTSMLLAIEKPCMHLFTGYEETSDLILLTNRNHKNITLEQIHEGKAKEFNAGVIVRTNNLREILDIRTYSDLLFRLTYMGNVQNEPKAIAKALCEWDLLSFLNARHKGCSPYYFRIEVKSKMTLDKKSSFTKKIASELESISKRQLINSTSHYELEIRLVENKEGLYNVLIKLYTLKDERFHYRKNTVAASIAPSQAALIAALAKDYLKEDAQVLDPFCGVGTMLIERHKLVSANPMYGIDSFGPAIDKAIENTALDQTLIHYINRDFFDFRHEYLFDEIFTNMPTGNGRKTEEEMELLYNKFFDKALEVLKDEGILVIYTRDKACLIKGVHRRKEYSVLQMHEISKKEDAYLYILQINK